MFGKIRKKLYRFRGILWFSGLAFAVFGLVYGLITENPLSGIVLIAIGLFLLYGLSYSGKKEK